MHKSFLVFMLLINSLEIVFVWHLFINFAKNLRYESFCFKVIKEHNVVVIILFPDGWNVALHILLVILVHFLDALLYLVSAQCIVSIVTFISFCFFRVIDFHANYIEILFCFTAIFVDIEVSAFWEFSYIQVALWEFSALFLIFMTKLIYSEEFLKLIIYFKLLFDVFRRWSHAKLIILKLLKSVFDRLLNS